ncbi:hypothetical protein ES703_113194 [subsurface metagenome]
MWIEAFKQPIERPLHYIVPFHRVHIILINQANDLIENHLFPVKIIGAFLGLRPEVGTRQVKENHAENSGKEKNAFLSHQNLIHRLVVAEPTGG